MGATLTTAVTLLVAVLAGIGIPLLLSRRKANRELDSAAAQTYKNLTDSLQTERTELRQQIKESEEQHHRELAEVKAEFTRQLDAARVRITELEQELRALRRAVREGGHA